MGSGIGFGPKKNAPKYADSYFYNSPDMKYPTINDQKKLARSIAATLQQQQYSYQQQGRAVS